jgi:hypothetical protein
MNTIPLTVEALLEGTSTSSTSRHFDDTHDEASAFEKGQALA